MIAALDPTGSPTMGVGDGASYWRKSASPTRRPRGNCRSKEENCVQTQVRHVAPEVMKTYLQHIRRHALNEAAAALEPTAFQPAPRTPAVAGPGRGRRVTSHTTSHNESD